MKKKLRSYKRLLHTFIWLFSSFIITLNIGASIIMAAENNYRSNKHDQMSVAIIANFSSSFNVSIKKIRALINEVNHLEDDKERPMTYLESIILVLSLFFTIGKNLHP